MNKIENIVTTLSRLANVDIKQAKDLMNKYSTMSEIEIIKDLSMVSYRIFSNNEGLLNYALTLIRSINTSICPSIKEMKEMIKNRYNNVVESNMSLEENHKLIKDSLYNFTTMFNEAGIDYYIVGALPCFAKTGQPLFRYHDDIDIMINEDDIEKAKQIIEICEYTFYDDRFPSKERFLEMQETKPPHIVLAQNPDNEFHLGFFCFKREKDNSITMREYSHRIEGEYVVSDVLERRTTPEGTKLRYDDTPIEYAHATFKTSTIESVYHLKEYTKRAKDISDNKILEPYVDKEKLQLLRDNPQTKATLINVGLQNEIKKAMKL